MAEPGQTLPDGFRLVRRMASPRAWLAVHPETPRRPVLVREPAPRWHPEVVHAPPDQELTWFDGGLALAWRIDGAALMSEPTVCARVSSHPSDPANRAGRS